MIRHYSRRQRRTDNAPDRYRRSEWGGAGNGR